MGILKNGYLMITNYILFSESPLKFSLLLIKYFFKAYFEIKGDEIH
jgi:hypothetical protein